MAYRVPFDRLWDIPNAEEKAAFAEIRIDPAKFGFKSAPEFGTSLWLTRNYSVFQGVNSWGFYRGVELMPVEFDGRYWISRPDTKPHGLLPRDDLTVPECLGMCPTMLSEDPGDIHNDRKSFEWVRLTDNSLIALPVVDAQFFAVWASNGLIREIISGHVDPQLRWVRVKLLSYELHFWYRKWRPSEYSGRIIKMETIKAMSRRFQAAGYASGPLSPLETLRSEKMFVEAIQNEARIRAHPNERDRRDNHRVFYAQGYSGPMVEAAPSMLKPATDYKFVIGRRD